MNQQSGFEFAHIFTKYFWMYVFFNLTGGRPMIDCGYAFTDIVSGKPVRYYQDSLGRMWLSDGGKWGLFRVEKTGCKNGI